MPALRGVSPGSRNRHRTADGCRSARGTSSGRSDRGSQTPATADRATETRHMWLAAGGRRLTPPRPPYFSSGGGWPSFLPVYGLTVQM